MTLITVRIPAATLVGRDQFHDTFAKLFGFPPWYGKNMDAWIDCMSYLRYPDAGMTKIHISPTQTLTILIDDYEVLRDAAPKQ